MNLYIESSCGHSILYMDTEKYMTKALKKKIQSGPCPTCSGVLGKEKSSNRGFRSGKAANK